MTSVARKAPSLDAHDWQRVERDLDRRGYAVVPGLLAPDLCKELSASYHREGCYRSTITMARHGFGKGEYKYFSYPLPTVLEGMRHGLYAKLVSIANRWNEELSTAKAFPPTLDRFLERCHAAGQTKPTPLILQYGAGDYNCLHQDLYGEFVFPVQVAVLLSQPLQDFSGGEFVMTEARSQTHRAHVVALEQGDAVVFAVHHRPVASKGRRPARAAMRHGVSKIRSGRRHTVGLIFHDAA